MAMCFIKHLHYCGCFFILPTMLIPKIEKIWHEQENVKNALSGEKKHDFSLPCQKLFITSQCQIKRSLIFKSKRIWIKLLAQTATKKL